MDDADLEELKLIFLDECLENIELLEQGLMRMGEGDDTDDVLNEVFRAAHSIKGGAATFGYQPMSELTHYMETLLDEMRSRRRPVVESDIDLLLTGLDAVQHIQDESRSASEADHPERQAIQKLLEESVAASPVSKKSSQKKKLAADNLTSTSLDETSTVSGLSIGFIPNSEFIQRGNDPLLLLRELSRLGDTVVSLDTSNLPAWDVFEPAISYLSWKVELIGSVKETVVREIFEWVDTDCTLEIQVHSIPEIPLMDQGVDTPPTSDVSTAGSNTPDATVPASDSNDDGSSTLQATPPEKSTSAAEFRNTV